jgi:hypothetical protein
MNQLSFFNIQESMNELFTNCLRSLRSLLLELIFNVDFYGISLKNKVRDEI